MSILTVEERATKERAPIGELRALVEQYYDVQKFRIAGNNRMKALQRGDSSAERLEIHIERLKQMEQDIAADIDKVVRYEAIYPWLIGLRGCGPVMAGALIASGIDPNIDKPSSWWRFAGCGVIAYCTCGEKLVPAEQEHIDRFEDAVDGGYCRECGNDIDDIVHVEKSREWTHDYEPSQIEVGKIICPKCGVRFQEVRRNQRKRRGEKLSYNGELARTLEVLCGQFLKAHRPPDSPSFYADLYYRFRSESIANRPHIGAGVGKDIHHHRRAIMLVQRVFLTHLQQRWREALGLPPARVPYIHVKEPGRHELIEAP